MKDNGNFPFLANQTGKFSSLMTSRQTLLTTNFKYFRIAN